jgi:uncharacterized membrane protein YraQ (UPF0718 family)
VTTIIIIYGLLAVSLVVSLMNSREKTQKAFYIALKAFKKTAPSLLAVLGIVGLTLGLLTPEKIGTYVGAEAGFSATVIGTLIGSVTLIPSLVAFPLAGSLLRSGATVMTISAFITSLVMVGFVTAPMEIQTLGKRFTLLRNGLALIAVLGIAVIMGAIL